VHNEEWNPYKQVKFLLFVVCILGHLTLGLLKQALSLLSAHFQLKFGRFFSYLKVVSERGSKDGFILKERLSQCEKTVGAGFV
jgi:hypothetical protein